MSDPVPLSQAERPESCADLLRAMVRVDSVTPRTSGRADAERPLGDYLARLARHWGLSVTRVPVPGCADNLVIGLEKGPGLPWWAFDAHLDTVGVAGMTVDPFAAEVRDGRLWGRGACDTKGPAAAMLWALRQTALAGDAGANLAVWLTVGEEDHQVGAQTLARGHRDALGWSPRGVVVAEPTRMQAVAAANGFVRWKLRTVGLAAHTTRAHEGRNAVADMARAIVALNDRHVASLSATHPLTGRECCSINVVRGGTELNIVPDDCVATVDHRTVPGQPFDGVLQRVRAILEGLGRDDPGFDCRIEHVESVAAFADDQSLALAQGVAERLCGVGIASAVTGAPYTSNANHYAEQGLPCVILGPGDIAQAHTRDEWIDLAELEHGVAGYRALMASPPQSAAP